MASRAAVASLLLVAFCLCAAATVGASGPLAPSNRLARRVLQHSGHSGSSVNLTLGSTISGLSFENITGVWKGVGDHYTAAEWNAYFKANTLPDCKGNTSSSYKHWSEPFPDTLAFGYSTTAKAGFGLNGHDDTAYPLTNVSYDGSFVRLTYEGDSEGICARLQVYVDTRDGLVYSRVVWMTEWKRTNGTVSSKDISCSAPATATTSCTIKDANTVHAVSVASYQCKAGNCLRFSPAFKEKHQE